MAARFLVGTSGFAYDEWVGPFYPRSLAGQRHEWLGYYAEHFPTVEINSSFYRMPTEPMVRAWSEKAKGLAFEFALKVPQTVTHEHMVNGDLANARRDLDAFLAVLAPLRERLGPLLFQLSPFFRFSERGLETLGEMLAQARAAGAAVAAEFRHSSWLDRETRELRFEAKRALKRHDAALVATDGPGFPAMLLATARHGYVRFHGRNPDLWFRGKEPEAGEEPDDEKPAPGARASRYDYLYTEKELEPWARRLKEAARSMEPVRVFFNNHPVGKAAKNALMMMDLLGVPHRPKDVHVQAQGRLDAF